MHGGYWNIGKGIGMFSNYFWIFFIARGIFAVALIYFLYRLIKKSNMNTKDDESLKTLKMRFVNDEITEEEYLHKRNLLNE